MNDNFRPLYLFSLPRSGSTLTQRLLGAHSEISTVAEPWILLPLLYTLKDQGVTAEYNHQYYRAALTDFLNQWPTGHDDYQEAIRNLSYQMYGHIMAQHPGKYFLDKTPRYHFIAQEILDLFPDGKFIFLFRNPLAVAASIVTSWCGGDFKVHRYNKDILEGMQNLMDVQAGASNEVLTLRYEDLVEDPEGSLQSIWDYLEIESQGVAGALDSYRISGNMGDTKGRSLRTVSKDSLFEWVSVMNSPVRRRWCRNYLKRLGHERLSRIGYNAESLLDELGAIPVSYNNILQDIYHVYLLPLIDSLWSGLRGVISGQEKRSRW